MPDAKRFLLQTLTSRRLSRVWKPFMSGRATVFMLHRFANTELSTLGHDSALLQRSLAYLRRERYDIIELRELFRRLAEGMPAGRPAVAFTMDDGYLDQASAAGDIFAAFDCPVTMFVTTGFLDGSVWFWWDRIEYIFAHTGRRTIELALGETSLRYIRDPVVGYAHAQADFITRCNRVSEQAKLEGIAHLAAAADVEVPALAPRRYAPMSWDQARALEYRGISFGPHTVTHPTLSRTGDDQSEREISASWERLRTCVRSPLPIFCYPNGQADDYGTREINALKAMGLTGAVVGTAGYAETCAFVRDADGPFQVRRFSYFDDLRLLTQCVSGLERFKEIVRGQG